MVADGSEARKLAASEAEVQTPYCGKKADATQEICIPKQNEPVTVATGSSNCDCSEVI
jgi:hypothetical protein